MRKSIHTSGRRQRSVSAPALEWLKEAATGEARATVTGARHALIENYAAILEFGPELVRLSARNGEIRVQGRDLRLAEVRGHSLIVRGWIDAIDMPPMGARTHA